MQVIIYSRVSTEKQTLEQQERTVREWLERNGLEATAEVSDEGVSGGTSYKDRKLGKVVLPMLGHGDVLIVAELSRLGRSIGDISKFINEEMKPRGVRLVIVQMGIDLDCGKIRAIDEMMLFGFSFAAQVEKELIQERTQSAIDVRKKKLEEEGSFVSKTGRVCRKLGNPTDEGLKRARAAAAEKKTGTARESEKNRAIWAIVKRHATDGGMTRQQASMAAIELADKGMTTPSGKPFTTKRARYCYHNLKKFME